MAVRNFWIEANIDGRNTDLSGGPRNKEGGMNIHVYQRNDGSIEDAVTLSCYEKDGELVTAVFINHEFVAEYRTRR